MGTIGSCNPKKYESNFYHLRFDMTSNKIWEKDKIRIDKIFRNKDVNSIIVIWEDSK
jgi:hypothetical protein